VEVQPSNNLDQVLNFDLFTMVAIISSFLRAASLSSLLASTAFATLHSLPAPLIAKRQNPNDTVGTNLYNCHNNCGT
jgi:hypothetical protein